MTRHQVNALYLPDSTYCTIGTSKEQHILQSKVGQDETFKVSQGEVIFIKIKIKTMTCSSIYNE